MHQELEHRRKRLLQDLQEFANLSRLQVELSLTSKSSITKYTLEPGKSSHDASKISRSTAPSTTTPSSKKDEQLLRPISPNKTISSSSVASRRVRFASDIDEQRLYDPTSLLFIGFPHGFSPQLKLQLNQPSNYLQMKRKNILISICLSNLESIRFDCIYLILI
ncbi:hypothetical protein GEMRC1_006221 [Eukaryota sp. GEM-RC1]